MIKIKAWCFNSTLVRFKLPYFKHSFKLTKRFNSTLVRFKRITRLVKFFSRKVSIPLW